VNSRIALLIAVPVIVVFVLVLTIRGYLASPVVIAVVVVLYAVVSLFNRRKFARQKQKQEQERN
jgi:undecaprenyl pyrophosphate phosphatase UppP